MKKVIISMAVLVAWATTLSAQITREQADTIVKEHLQQEGVAYNLLYVNVNAPRAEGFVLTTSAGEEFTAKYACWAYYLTESERSQCRYLFVKEDNGNLLEVITSNDFGQQDSTQWKTLENDDVGLVEREESNIFLYPNPTTGQLIIDNGQLAIESIEIYDVVGRKAGAYTPLSPLKGGISPFEGGWGMFEITVDLSHLPAGIYFLTIYGEKRVVYKVVKQ